MKTIEVRSKVWLEVDDEPLLGERRERLLRLAEQAFVDRRFAAAFGNAPEK